MNMISLVQEIENYYFSVLESKQDINIFPVSLLPVLHNVELFLFCYIFFLGSFHSENNKRSGIFVE